MLKTIKQQALRMTRTAGLFSLFQGSKWRRSRLLILAYHGVAINDEHQWDPALYISRNQFRARLQLISKLGCTVLPLGRALHLLYADDLPERSVTLTFDDGTYDFFSEAYPVLDEFGFPATVYLTTFYVYYNRPVFDVMTSYLLWKGRGLTLNMKALTGYDYQFNLVTEESRSAALKELHDFATSARFSAEEKDELCAKISNQLHINYDELLKKRILHIMKPEEVSWLASHGVDIQLHTHRHRTPMDESSFAREIEDNRTSIQDMTGSAPVHFCYPSGIYHQGFLPWLKDNRIASATTCYPNIAARTSNPLILPRVVDTSYLSSVEFEGWLTGISALLPQRPRV